MHRGRLGVGSGGAAGEVGQPTSPSEPTLPQLGPHLPHRLQQQPWSLLYCTARDGFSLRTLYRRAGPLSSPALLLIRDTDAQVRPKPIAPRHLPPHSSFTLCVPESPGSAHASALQHCPICSSLPLPGLRCVLRHRHSHEQQVLRHGGNVSLLVLPRAEGGGCSCGVRGKGGPEGGGQPCPTARPCWKNPKVLVEGPGTGQGNAAALGPPGTKPPGRHTTGPSQWDGNWGREGGRGWSVGLRGLMPDGAISGRQLATKRAPMAAAGDSWGLVPGPVAAAVPCRAPGSEP